MRKVDEVWEYQVPLRGVVQSRNAGYAAAINAGASQARGRLLVLQHSDVLAARPGWLSTLAEYYAAQKKIGALGPKLLYEDRSIQHAGIDFSQDLDPDDDWSNVYVCRGLPRLHPAANITRRAPALSSACLMIDRQLFERLGGLRDQYIAGDYEDVDLCLRCHAEDRECWYLPQAELFHLTGQSRKTARGWRRNAWSEIYNRRLQTRIWGERIQELISEHGTQEHSGGTEA